jgi:hypothetical protein
MHNPGYAVAPQGKLDHEKMTVKAHLIVAAVDEQVSRGRLWRVISVNRVSYKDASAKQT